MHLDVQDLRDFYYRNPLGRAAQTVIRARLMRMWPEAKGQSVVGFGFAVPLLRPYLSDARRVIALMPGPQGVMPWPADRDNVSVLAEETSWPLETGHVDKLVLMHGLETSEHPSAVLEECWRVLGPGGKVVFIVPNRAGLWARRDRTPFGFGRPYSLSQLETQLRTHGFLPEQHDTMLYFPPSTRRFWMRAGPMIERAGRRVPQITPSGVLMVEASKRVQAVTGSGARDVVRKPLEVLAPAPAGKAAPV
ncbi:methyltransferase domain-containing protein [Pseudaestuariivita atlantica]|uniref:ATP synthase n=1 Tax=Pseudaestuariivita atlantica TaxID=1317121 RepID=A0A0L1JLH8_9RHOB|nr:methyltransferase domain-containing protein [Pseudaestuariivita atlantica]KNG92605.1 ATP synthase [Pseudaestuariivita atlantica]